MSATRPAGWSPEMSKGRSWVLRNVHASQRLKTQPRIKNLSTAGQHTQSLSGKASRRRSWDLARGKGCITAKEQ